MQAGQHHHVYRTAKARKTRRAHTHVSLLEQHLALDVLVVRTLGTGCATTHVRLELVRALVESEKELIQYLLLHPRCLVVPQGVEGRSLSRVRRVLWITLRGLARAQALPRPSW